MQHLSSIIILMLFFQTLVWSQTYEEERQRGLLALDMGKYQDALLRFRSALAYLPNGEVAKRDTILKELYRAQDAWFRSLEEDKDSLRTLNDTLEKRRRQLEYANRDLKFTNAQLDTARREAERRGLEAEARRLAFIAEVELEKAENSEQALAIAYYAYEKMGGQFLESVSRSFGDIVYKKTAEVINGTNSSLDRISLAAFSPKSDQLLIAGRFGPLGTDPKFGLQLLTIQNERAGVRITERKELSFSENPGITCLNFSPDGQRFLAGTRKGGLFVWNNQGMELAAFPPQNGAVLSACFIGGGLHILAGLQNSFVQVWDVESGKLLEQRQGAHVSSVYGVDYTPTARRFLSRSADRIVHLWDAQDYRLRTNVEDHPLYAYKAVFSPDGSQFLTVAADRQTGVRLWDSGEGQRLRKLESPIEATAIDADYSQDGRLVYVLYDDRTISIYNTDGDQLGAPIDGFSSNITTAAFSPNGRYLLVGMENGVAQLLDVENRGQVMQLDKLSALSSPIRHVAFSSDGAVMLTLTQDGRLVLANSPDWMLKQLQESPSKIPEDVREKYGIR